MHVCIVRKIPSIIIIASNLIIGVLFYDIRIAACWLTLVGMLLACELNSSSIDVFVLSISALCLS